MTSKHWKQIFYILDEHCAHIRWVKLFGSRARGAYRNTSDIDLAIVCEQDIRSELLAAFEESRLPYTFDLVLYDARLDEKLRDMIDRDGKLLFCSVGGRSMMTVERIRLKKENYHRVLIRLQAALEKEADIDDMYLDATIQRFEFCFELAWKLMKAVLEYDGIEANSPRSCIREGWKQGLISGAEEWLEMMEKRNLSSYTYDEKATWEIYHEVKDPYIDLLAAFNQKMTDWLRNEDTFES